MVMWWGITAWPKWREPVKSCCHRKADLAVRYGGEEFAVLLPDTDIHGAMTIAEQIRRSVMGKNIKPTGSPTGYVTVSLGCYSFVPTGRDSMEVFIQRADAALYQAKHSGETVRRCCRWRAGSRR